MYGEWWAAGQNRVPFLCNQLLLHLLTQIFETFQNVYWHTEDVHETDYDPIWRIFSIFFMLLKNICRGYLFCVINLLLFHWKIILCMIFRCLKQVLYSLLITIRLFWSDPFWLNQWFLLKKMEASYVLVMFVNYHFDVKIGLYTCVHCTAAL